MSLIIVNGLPGSGKTTLATQLATELSLPLFRKDAIKETLADALTAFRPREETNIEWSQQLGQAAAACLWRLLSVARGNAILGDVGKGGRATRVRNRPSSRYDSARGCQAPAS